jgi:SAM-dependent methyltransferase
LAGRVRNWKASLKVEATIVDAAKKGAKRPPEKAKSEEKSAQRRQRARPDTPPFFLDTSLQRPAMFRSILSSQKPGRMLDLGAGHGRFAQLAQDMGWDVTAVDARGERFPRTQGIEWIVSDVRTFEFGPGDYDCVSVLGLFYHLDLADQLELLRKCSGTFTLLETHVAVEAETTEGGYEGKIYVEAPPTVTDEQLRSAPQSAWGNRQAFWPTEDGLLKMIRDSGFSFVAPVRPFYYADRGRYMSNRTFYLCYP